MIKAHSFNPVNLRQARASKMKTTNGKTRKRQMISQFPSSSDPHRKKAQKTMPQPRHNGKEANLRDRSN
jgi:hypothetical protein